MGASVSPTTDALNCCPIPRLHKTVTARRLGKRLISGSVGWRASERRLTSPCGQQDSLLMLEKAAEKFSNIGENGVEGEGSVREEG